MNITISLYNQKGGKCMTKEEIQLLVEFTRMKDFTEAEELKELISILFENLNRHLDITH